MPVRSHHTFARGAAGLALLWAGLLASGGCIADLPLPTATGGAGGVGGTPSGGGTTNTGGMGGQASCNLSGAPAEAACVTQPLTDTGCDFDFGPCFQPNSLGGNQCACGQTCPDPACPTPSESCPAAITDLGGECVMLPAEPDGECMFCGCSVCMNVCDGRGATVAMNPPSGPAGVLAWNNADFSSVESGTLGIYLRARGVLDQTTLGSTMGQFLPLGEPVQAVDPLTEFAEYVVEDVASWTSGAGQPSTIRLQATAGVPIVAEIDCVIPFVVP